MKKKITDYPDSSQLFTLIPALSLYDYLSQNKLKVLDASNLPFLTWPDGSPCLQANAYMIKLRMRSGRGGDGPSRLGSKGGTFGDYAGKISHLLRFCYFNKLALNSLSDDDFYDFIDGLRKARKLNNPKQQKRSERTITSIGRRCLSFLSYIGEMNHFNNYVGVDGIIAIEMIDSVAYRNGKAFKRSSVHHRSFRHRVNAKKTRKPISEPTIQKLRDAIDGMSPSDFLYERRHLMISVLEETGARRGEIQPITVTQVYAAAAMKKPTITLNTLKRGGDTARDLEISPTLITELVDFVRGTRRLVMDKSRFQPDHGYLFITERGGRPLQTDSFTSEFSLIRRSAGIEVQACAHLFRHAFCTNIVASLIAEIQAQSPDSFRQTLLTDKALAEYAMAKSGHATLESFLNYVDAAFKIKSKFENVIENISAAQNNAAYERRSEHLFQQLKTGRISTEKYIELKEALSTDEGAL